MHTQQVLIVVTVPPDNVEVLLEAISAAGGGIVGDYTHCAYSSAGTGRFKPSAAAKPNLGAKSTINTVEEHRIETFCDRQQAKAVVAAIRAAHPYEEPVIYVIPLLAEADL
jgi:hypothetical protein